jgi:hypothetical protein
MCYVETDHHNCRPQGAIASADCAERQLDWRNALALFRPTRSGRCPFEVPLRTQNHASRNVREVPIPGHQKQLYALATRRYYRVQSWQSVRGESFDANAYACPCDDNADRNLQSGQRAGAMPRIDPTAQRGCRGLKTDEARPDIGPLRSVHSFFHGMGCHGPIRE